MEPGATSKDPHGGTRWAPSALGWGRRVAGLAGVPGVDLLAGGVGGLFVQPVAGEQLAVQDQVGGTVGLGLDEVIVQVGGLGGEHVDDLGQVAVAGGAADAMATSQGIDLTVLTEPPQPEHDLLEQVNALLPRRVPRARRWASNNRPTDWAHCARHVENGTISNHRQSSPGVDLVVRPLYRGLPAQHQHPATSVR